MGARGKGIIIERFIKGIGSIAVVRFYTFFGSASLIFTCASLLVWGRFLTVSNKMSSASLVLGTELRELRKLRVAINNRYEIYRKKAIVTAHPTLIEDFMSDLHRVAAQYGVRVEELKSYDDGAEGAQGDESMHIVAVGTYGELVRFLGAIQAVNSELFVESLLLRRPLSAPTTKRLEAVLDISRRHARKTVLR